LALKSTRKYVKKETYSPIPLVVDTSQVWDFDLKLYRDITVSTGAILTLANTFEFPYNGTITVNNCAALVIEGSVKLSNNNRIIVKKGGTLKVESGSSVDVRGNGYINIQPGGYICVQSGANIVLQNTSSTISVKVGAELSANPLLFSESSCASSIAFTGYGKVIMPVNGKDKITCNEITFSSNDSFTAASYIWTTSSNIQIVSGANTKTVKVKGKSYHASNSWIKATVISGGQTYTSTKNVTVNIPGSFVLSLGETEVTDDGKRKVKITAVAHPDSVKPTACIYRWSAEGGTITTKEREIFTPELAVSDHIWLVIDSLIRYKLPAIFTTIDEKAVEINQVASAVSNLSSSKSLLYEITEISDEESEEEADTDETARRYLAVEADKATNTATVITRPIDDDLIAFPVWSSSTATLTYTPGTSVTVLCEIEGCDKSYSATLAIPNYPYNTSYVPSSRSICLLKDQTLPTGSVHTYQVQLFNDYGYIKTVTFTSNETTVLIPLNSLPNGNYYINVVDEQNNIVERKLIIAN
jgi:hypothetical protein